MSLSKNLLPLLDTLEKELRQQGLWQINAPDAKALGSEQPFAIDTLQPEQWLQWIFIAQMRECARQPQNIPRGFAIYPYFSEVWKEQNHYATLLRIVKRIDEVCQ